MRMQSDSVNECVNMNIGNTSSCFLEIHSRISSWEWFLFFSPTVLPVCGSAVSSRVLPTCRSTLFLGFLNAEEEISCERVRVYKAAEGRHGGRERLGQLQVREQRGRASLLGECAAAPTSVWSGPMGVETESPEQWELVSMLRGFCSVLTSGLRWCSLFSHGLELTLQEFHSGREQGGKAMRAVTGWFGLKGPLKLL